MAIKLKKLNARRRQNQFHRLRSIRRLKAGTFFRPRQLALKKRWLNLRSRSRAQTEVILAGKNVENNNVTEEKSHELK